MMAQRAVIAMLLGIPADRSAIGFGHVTEEEPVKQEEAKPASTTVAAPSHAEIDPDEQAGEEEDGEEGSKEDGEEAAPADTLPVKLERQATSMETVEANEGSDPATSPVGEGRPRRSRVSGRLPRSRRTGSDADSPPRTPSGMRSIPWWRPGEFSCRKAW